jgi:hypothetical protein
MAQFLKCVVVGERLRLDVKVVSLCHEWLPPTLRQGLSLDVRRKTICSQNRSAGAITGKILTLAPVSRVILLVPKELRNFLDTAYGKNEKKCRRCRDYSIKPSGM